MNEIQTIIHDLLIEYQRLNQMRLRQIQEDMDIPPSETRRQAIEPPETAVMSEVPTLDMMHLQPMTDMLNARFSYAGSWKMADAGHEWLSLKQMKQAPLDKRVIQRVRDMISYWDGTPLLKLPFSRISLFGMHPHQGEEIYLLWPAVAGEEPEVLSYVGNFETRYPNLEQYLRALIHGAGS